MAPRPLRTTDATIGAARHGSYHQSMVPAARRASKQRRQSLSDCGARGGAPAVRHAASRPRVAAIAHPRPKTARRTPRTPVFGLAMANAAARACTASCTRPAALQDDGCQPDLMAATVKLLPFLDRSLQSAGPGHDLDEALHTTAYRTALPPRRCALLSEGTKCVLLPFLPELASCTGRLEAVPGRVPAGVPVFVLVDNLIQRLRTLASSYR